MALTKVRGLGLGTLDESITFSTAGKGVHLGVTSATSSNLLDDYEEGTWTPGFKLGSTACTVTSEGNYTRVGRVVTVNIYMSITNTNSGSGTATVSNFPTLV